MPYDDILCSWLVRSALVSLTILLIGTGAVLVWRQPVRRVRIIELVLAGCLITPWLGMLPGYPQLAIAWWHTAAINQHEAPLPPSVGSEIEPTISEPMPFPVSDLGTEPVPSTETVEAAPLQPRFPATSPCFRDSFLDHRRLSHRRGRRGWLVACGNRGTGTHLVGLAARTATLPRIACRDFRRAWRSGPTLGEPPPEPAVCLCLGASGDRPS
jgi:hypothetical protein